MKGRRNILKTMVSAVLALAVSVTFFIPSAPINLVEAAEIKGLGPRQMEALGRGVVAVRSGSNVFISWRLLALDPADIGFNLYRSTSGKKAIKLNSSPLTQGTNFTDTTADLTKENTYYVRPVINGVEQAASGSYTLQANPADEPCIVVPIRATGQIHHIWVGDFDGDQEYDFLVDRVDTTPQTIEAYKRDGTFLWSVNLGPNSSNKNNISPGSATIDVGHWDGVTVYDLDGDGKAEVALKIANGVVFGDGQVWEANDDNKQWIAVLDGMTGKLKAACQVPEDFLSVGSMGAQLGIAYINGVTPSVIAHMKNRNADKSFNIMVCAFSYVNGELVMNWKWTGSDKDYSDGHMMKIADIDQDGKDEICQIGFALDDDGSLYYNLREHNIYHGDRFYIGKYDPDREGLQGYGIQQDNQFGLLEYYYDAGTGEMIWQHYTTPPAGDVGRGVFGDIDPNYPGYEVWSFSGKFNVRTNTQLSPAEQKPLTNADNRLWPALRFLWDGDLLSESLNNGKIEEWDYTIGGDLDNWDYSIKRVRRLLYTYDYNDATSRAHDTPMFYGDILGDWREEAVYTNSNYSALVIFTTNIPTEHRIYTLAQNPLYRVCMAAKGYPTSHITDYYLGHGMDTPPRPNIYYALAATVKVNPNTLNLKSNGGANSVTVNIDIPAEFAIFADDLSEAVAEINGSEVTAEIQKGNKNKPDDIANSLVLKLDRAKVIKAINKQNGTIDIKIKGKFANGCTFTGTDVIKAIH